MMRGVGLLGLREYSWEEWGHMKRNLLRLAVALLTFAVGVTAAALWLPRYIRHPQPASHVVIPPQAPLEPTEPFTRVGHLSAMTLDHGCVNSETYQAADGSYLSFSQESFSSPAQAAKELRRKIKQAARVVERTPVTDEAGRQIGQRVVVLWGADETRASVFWTRESQSLSLQADSLEQALEFERWNPERR